MQLSASNLALSRVHPQQTDLYLSVFQPRTVLACLVNNGSALRGDRVIPFDTVSSGSFSAVEVGMSLLVGTTAGARDVGKIRIKSITSSQIVVSENSHINWADNLFLTVLRYWEVWPVYPFNIIDPTNSENVIFYKDYDIAYTNQNSILGALVSATPHKAGFVGEQFYFSASGTSHVVAGATLSYNWAFEGATVTGSTSNTPGNITWNTPGHYVIRLIVTGSNGSVDTTYRYVSVYNKPENSAVSNPVKNWELQSIGGSRGEGGNRGSIRIVNEDIEIDDGSVVVLWADDWYGSTNTSLGGNALNNSKIFFSGHVINNTIRFNAVSSSIDFEIGNISEIMKITETYAISLETSASPIYWYQMLDMNSKKAIYHYLRWHSTVLYLADIEFVGTDQNIQYFDTDRQSIFDAVDNYMRGTLVGSLVSDRQGKLWAEVGSMAYNNPTGSFPNVMSIIRGDWIGEPTIQENLSDTLSFIELGGIAYSGTSTGNYQAFLSQAPGATPNGRGRPDNITGLAIASQSQLNTIAGNIYAHRNAQYPTIDMDMAIGFRNLDIAPQNSVGIDIIPSDTSLGIELHAPYIVDSLGWSRDVGNKILKPSIGFTALVNGTAGETITIPEIPDDGGFGDNNFGGGFRFNPISFPAMLPSLFGSLKYWSGHSTLSSWSLAGGPISFVNFIYDAGDSTLAIGNLSGILVLFPGLYWVNYYFTVANSDFTDILLTIASTASPPPYSGGRSQELIISNYTTTRKGEVNAFLNIIASPANLVAPQVSYVKTDVIDQPTAQAHVSIIKLF